MIRENDFDSGRLRRTTMKTTVEYMKLNRRMTIKTVALNLRVLPFWSPFASLSESFELSAIGAPQNFQRLQSSTTSSPFSSSPSSGGGRRVAGRRSCLGLRSSLPNAPRCATSSDPNEMAVSEARVSIERERFGMKLEDRTHRDESTRICCHKRACPSPDCTSVCLP